MRFHVFNKPLNAEVLTVLDEISIVSKLWKCEAIEIPTNGSFTVRIIANSFDSFTCQLIEI